MARLSSGWAMLFKVLLAEGLVLLVFGLINLLFVPQTWLLSLGFLLTGLVLVLAGIVGRLASVGTWITSAKARYALLTLIYVLLFLAGLGLVNYLSQMHFNRSFDMTRSKVNTLSDRTAEVLQSLDSPIQILAFFPDGDPYKPDAERMLDLYQRDSQMIKVRFIDPIKSPLAAQEYGFTESTGMVALTEDSKHTFEEPTEPNITTAILSVTKGSQGSVYLLKGHGEAGLEAAAVPDQEARSLKSAADHLRNENYRVATLDLLTAGKVPEDAALLIIAGPSKELAPQEIDAISDYLAGGGRALFMLEPLYITGLEPLLARYGIELPDSVIIEQTLRLFQGPTLGIEFIADNLTSHSITSKIRDGIIFILARAIVPSEDRPAGTFITTLVKSGQASWAETDLETLMEQEEIALTEDDISGPVPIAVAVESFDAASPAPDKAKTRLVVIGDSDFALDEAIGLGRDNVSLFVNAVNWLAESEPVEVTPHRYESSLVMLQPAQAGLLFYAIVFVVPQLLTLLGIALIGVRRVNR